MIAPNFRSNQGKNKSQMTTCAEMMVSVNVFLNILNTIYYLLYLSVVITLGIKPRTS